MNYIRVCNVYIYIYNVYWRYWRKAAQSSGSVLDSFRVLVGVRGSNLAGAGFFRWYDDVRTDNARQRH